MPGVRASVVRSEEFWMSDGRSAALDRERRKYPDLGYVTGTIATLELRKLGRVDHFDGVVTPSKVDAVKVVKGSSIRRFRR
jgi:hypothetical protein